VEKPSRGDVWYVDLNPIQGREQAGRRPALIISVNQFNHGPAELVILLPMTTKNKRIPLHVEIHPPEAGLRERSFVKCEDIRSVSTERLVERIGCASRETLDAVEDRLRILLCL